MTPFELEVIRKTFIMAASDSQDFYKDVRRRALKLDSTAREVLPSLDDPQNDRLFAILGATLDALPSADAAASAAQALARQSRLVGMRPKHYGVIGQAFLDTLAARLGTSFNDTARAAWADAYVLLAESMMSQCYNQMDLVA